MTIREFPNRMGADVSNGSATFELFYPDLPIGRTTYDAKRTKDGCGVVYKRGFTAASHEEAARLIVDDYRENRSTWAPCEN
jgi:hypothetical protein